MGQTANNNDQLSPQQILSYNTAFADSLQKMNNTINMQAQMMTELTVYMMKELIALCDMAVQGVNVQEAITSLKEELESKLKHQPAAMKTDLAIEAPAGNTWYAEMMDALSNAQRNTVASQQQINVSLQAATTMGISTIYSVVTAAVGAAVKKKLDSSSAV